MNTAEQDGGTAGGPTVRRMLLGAQLRRLREAKGVSRVDAGWAIRGSESKISRIELGRVGFKERDIADLLTLYGVTDANEREAMLTLAQEANKPGWWQPYGDLIPNWLQNYLGPGGGGHGHPHLRGPVSSPGCSRPTRTPEPSSCSGSVARAPRRSTAAWACGWPASSCSPEPIHPNSGRSWTRPPCGARSAAPT